MKRIYDLTPEEILALGDDIQDYVNRELFEEGIPISALTLSVNESIEPTSPKACGYFFKIGDLNIGVYNADAAMDISRLLIESKVFKIDTDYFKGSYKAVYKKGDTVINLEPFQYACYTKEEIERVNKINNGVDKQNENEKQREKAIKIQHQVYDHIHNVKEEYEYNKKLCKIFDDYLKIADGDKYLAFKFLQQVYTFNDYTEEFIKKNKDMIFEPEESN